MLNELQVPPSVSATTTFPLIFTTHFYQKEWNISFESITRLAEQAFFQDKFEPMFMNFRGLTLIDNNRARQLDLVQVLY